MIPFLENVPLPSPDGVKLTLDKPYKFEGREYTFPSPCGGCITTDEVQMIQAIKLPGTQSSPYGALKEGLQGILRHEEVSVPLRGIVQV